MHSMQFVSSGIGDNGHRVSADGSASPAAAASRLMLHQQQLLLDDLMTPGWADATAAGGSNAASGGSSNRGSSYTNLRDQLNQMTSSCMEDEIQAASLFHKCSSLLHPGSTYGPLILHRFPEAGGRGGDPDNEQSASSVVNLKLAGNDMSNLMAFLSPSFTPIQTMFAPICYHHHREAV
jgi:hypothetical protein